MSPQIANRRSHGTAFGDFGLKYSPSCAWHSPLVQPESVYYLAVFLDAPQRFSRSQAQTQTFIEGLLVILFASFICEAIPGVGQKPQTLTSLFFEAARSQIARYARFYFV